MGYADIDITAAFSALSQRQYIVFFISTHGRAISGVFLITRIESPAEILSP